MGYRDALKNFMSSLKDQNIEVELSEDMKDKVNEIINTKIDNNYDKEIIIEDDKNGAIPTKVIEIELSNPTDVFSKSFIIKDIYKDYIIPNIVDISLGLFEYFGSTKIDSFNGAVSLINDKEINIVGSFPDHNFKIDKIARLNILIHSTNYEDMKLSFIFKHV